MIKEEDETSAGSGGSGSGGAGVGGGGGATPATGNAATTPVSLETTNESISLLHHQHDNNKFRLDYF